MENRCHLVLERSYCRRWRYCAGALSRSVTADLGPARVAPTSARWMDLKNINAGLLTPHLHPTINSLEKEPEVDQ